MKPPPKLQGNALGVLGPENPLRMYLATILAHKNFEFSVIALICVSSIILAVDSPNLQEEAPDFKAVRSFKPCLLTDPNDVGRACEGPSRTSELLPLIPSAHYQLPRPPALTTSPCPRMLPAGVERDRQHLRGVVFL